VDWPAIGWVAVAELALSVGKTNIGVSLVCIGGTLNSAGGASVCIGVWPKGWAFKAWTGGPKAGSNGVAEMACSTALRALFTAGAGGSGAAPGTATGCPWPKLFWVASGLTTAGALPNSEVVELLALFSGSIGIKS
jgi:hypothetical protein